MIPRLHLFEFMDQPWFPATYRRRMTDGLRNVEAFTRLYNSAVPLLLRLLRENGRRTLIDLGTGSGGPILRLFDRLRAEQAIDELVLTDLFPSPDAVPAREGVRYELTPVHATHLPADLKGMRVMCNAFHHLRPDEARAVFADAHARGEPLLVMEALSRDPFAMIAATSVALMAWLLAPFGRPFDAKDALWNWLVPVVPVLLVWEGLVSCIRCYSQREFRAMVADLPGARYEGGVVWTGFIGARIRWFYLDSPRQDALPDTASRAPSVQPAAA